MSIFSKIVEALTPAPEYTPQEQVEFLDGFRRGCPLEGQPDYPVHDSPAYQRGLRYGERAHDRAGRPQIPYEPPIISSEEEES
jgi:hypothetical protein